MRDLFGEIPVTVEELIAWCEAVPRISASSWRFAWYVRAWDVAEKIRQAKAAGTFDAIVSDRAPRPPTYGELLEELQRRRAAGAEISGR